MTKAKNLRPGKVYKGFYTEHDLCLKVEIIRDYQNRDVVRVSWLFLDGKFKGRICMCQYYPTENHWAEEDILV